MLNQVVIMGRIVSDPQIADTEEGRKVSIVEVACTRPYKNKNGEYDTDFIPVTLYNGVAENAVQYCHRGDLIGIKGRLQTDIVDADGEKKKILFIVAEKISFLSNKAGE